MIQITNSQIWKGTIENVLLTVIYTKDTINIII